MSTVFLPLPTLVATVGDPGRTRIVIGTVAVLVVIGIGLACAAVWLLRSTRTDPEVLAPLELLAERRWQRSAPDVQQRRLDEARPPGASPLGRPATRDGVDLGDELHDVQEPAPVDVVAGAADAGVESSDTHNGVGSAVEVGSEVDDEVEVDDEDEAEVEEPADAEPVDDAGAARVEPSAEVDAGVEAETEDSDGAPVDAANTRST